MTRTLLAWRRGSLRIALEFELADCWIGAFWCESTDRMLSDAPLGGKFKYVVRVQKRKNVWICLLPMLPIHVSWS